MLKKMFYVMLFHMLDIVKLGRTHWIWNERLFVISGTGMEVF